MIGPLFFDGDKGDNLYYLISSDDPMPDDFVITKYQFISPNEIKPEFKVFLEEQPNTKLLLPIKPFMVIYKPHARRYLR